MPTGEMTLGGKNHPALKPLPWPRFAMQDGSHLVELKKYAVAFFDAPAHFVIVAGFHVRKSQCPSKTADPAIDRLDES